VRRGGFGADLFALRIALAILLPVLLLIMAVGLADAQSVPPPASLSPAPVTGFVPPYEIMRTVRAAGFDPLAPPLREGTTYVLRATDFRGILMRVVVDARTGAIRDANRIVPGPGLYGPSGYIQGGYGPALYGPRVYDPELARPLAAAPLSGEASADDMALPDAIPPSDGTPRLGAPGTSSVSSSTDRDIVAAPPHQPSVRSMISPPLPRPRPATPAAVKPSQDVPAAASVPDNRPDGSEPDLSASAAPATPKSAASPTKPGKGSGLPAIND
jgi:hypothetical protein